MKLNIKMNFVLTMVLTFCVGFMSMAQSLKVTGIVKDDTGAPLPGVTVVVKGTTNGTITNMDGHYTLKTTSKKILVFSFIGYKSVSMPVKGRSKIDLTLESDIQALGEVVAVGYGSQSVKDVTSSIASVRADDLAKAPVANFDEALAGRMSGVQVSAADGTPGSGMKIVIRGGNSVTGDNSPLYVVDGVAMPSFDPGSLSTNDIESMDVLKDAAASAIYGSRAANGVVLITTKGGKVGPTRINITLNSGIQRIPRTLDVLDPYHFVLLQKEVAEATGGTYLSNFQKYWVDPELYRDAKATNWQDEIFRTGVLNQANVNLSGGNQSTRHYASVSATDQKGTMIGTGFQKWNAQLKLDHKFNQKSQIVLNFTYTHTNQIGPRVSGNNRSSIIRDAITFRPVSPINNDGLEDGIQLDDRENLRFNPVKTLSNTERNYELDAFRATASFNYKITKDLVFKTVGNFSQDSRRLSQFFKYDTYQGRRGIDGINGYIQTYRYYTMSNTNTLNYKKKIRNNSFNVLLGQEMQYRVSDNLRANAGQMPIDDLGVNNLGLGTSFKEPSSSKTGNTMLSFFGRLNYSFKDRWLLAGTLRADGSSKFQGNNKWGYFPSGSFGYRMSEEPFMKDLNLFSNLKIRATWGQNGNNRIGDFSTMQLMGPLSDSGYSFGSNKEYRPGFIVSNLGGEDIKWETTTQKDIGVDLGFFDQKLRVTFDWYQKNTTDLLLYANMAPSTGFERTHKNIGEISNEGFELSIFSQIVKTRKFQWSTNFNISTNKNKTIALNDNQNELYTNPDWSYAYSEYQYVTRVGQPVGMMFGLQSDGVYSADDFNYLNGKYVLKKGVPNNGNRTLAPGAAKFIDQNGDGTINFNDRVIIGNPHPDFFGGITNNFSYKNLDLSIFFQFSYGGEVLNANRVELETPTTKTNFNYFPIVSDRYSDHNTEAPVNVIRNEGVYGAPPKGNFVSDRIVEDGSFLRLKTLSLGYSLGKRTLKKLKLSKFRMTVSAQNLFTWTEYSGYDPEVSVGRYGALTPGLDYSAYPMSQTYTLGLQLAF
ncbi:TonB-dependent receptor [Halosquirtibacter xylanolyticus]|uniref:SusC/RagA family TonB-linked outer membrane protein n=1 Tax=Halosquirtibacter xylanolyticus TaxID=3374599 RepID=UPI003748E52C|nr:TonB-dependent receptor [Prolixibacteraceae bacterium]